MKILSYRRLPQPGLPPNPGHGFWSSSVQPPQGPPFQDPALPLRGSHPLLPLCKATPPNPTLQVSPTRTTEASPLLSSSAPKGYLGSLTFNCSFLEAEILDFFCQHEREKKE